MKYGARKFSQKSYKDNDSLAKDLFSKYITNKRGHNIIKAEEDFLHDIVTEKGGVKYYFELEMKRNYPFTSRRDYKFSSVSFLGRKKRLHDKHPFHYIIICYETGCAVSCSSEKIYKKEYIEELNISKYERNGDDLFFRVPKDECYFFNLQQ
jgi:hypothetical protein